MGPSPETAPSAVRIAPLNARGRWLTQGRRVSMTPSNTTITMRLTLSTASSAPGSRVHLIGVGQVRQATAAAGSRERPGRRPGTRRLIRWRPVSDPGARRPACRSGVSGARTAGPTASPGPGRPSVRRMSSRAGVVSDCWARCRPDGAPPARTSLPVPRATSSVPAGMASSLLAGVNPRRAPRQRFGPIGGGLTSSSRLWSSRPPARRPAPRRDPASKSVPSGMRGRRFARRPCTRPLTSFSPVAGTVAVRPLSLDASRSAHRVTSRPCAASAQMTKTSSAMITSDQTG
jgi:hypothetical protein